MSDVLEYILSLQDGMSSKLQKIGISSETALNKFAHLEKKTATANKLMKSMGVTIGSLKGKLDLLKAEKEWIPASNIKDIRTYNNEISRLEKKINRLNSINGSRMKSWFRDAVNQVPFAGLITNPLVVSGLLAGKSIKTGIEQEFQSTSFEVILGSKNAAQKLVNDIRQYAAKTPYEKLGLGKAAQTMLGYGIAQEKIMDNLKMLGDIAMGDENKLNSLTLAFSQVQSTGRLTGQDLLQMINAGFNPLGVIAEKTGKTIGELKKEMEKGAISAQMIEEAFRSATGPGGKFFGMANKMSRTLGGRLSTLRDNFNDLFLNLFNIIAPLLHLALELLLSVTGGVVSLFGRLQNKIKEGNPLLLSLSAILGSVALAMGIVYTQQKAQIAWAALTTLWNEIQTASWWKLNAAILANPIMWIIAGIIALVGGIAYLIYRLDGWRNTWHNLIEYMKISFKIFKANIEVSWLEFQNNFLNGIETIKAAWYYLQALWDKERAQDGLRKLSEKQSKRAEEIAKARGKLDELRKNREQIKVLELQWNDKSVGDIINKAKKNIGISAPAIPGTNAILSNPSVPTLERTNNNGISEKIATGGIKRTNITINLGRNLVESINISKEGGFKENAEEMADQILDQLTRVLSLAQAHIL